MTREQVTREQVTEYALKAALAAFDLCGSMQGAIRETFAEYGFEASEQNVGDVLISALKALQDGDR